MRDTARRSPGIRFDRVSVDLGGRTVLRGLDLCIEGGEALVLLGRSGSGKSTTLRLVNALLRPSHGEVLVGGRAVSGWDPIALRRSTGYILQEIGLFPHFTVSRNIALVPRLLGWEEAAVESRVEELLALVGLEPSLRDRLPRELSGGQRQRVGIARALAGKPGALLCDEPFGALDPVTRFDLQREFGVLRERLGTTVLFVTHDVREALLLADRIAFLAEGTLRFLGSPEAFRACEEPHVARFRQAGLSS